MALPPTNSAGTSNPTQPPSDADMTQAFKDLARGEQTALVLESNLTSLERKLDDLLASFEESERQRVNVVDGETARDESDGNKR